jgi:HSP20 family protein
MAPTRRDRSWPEVFDRGMLERPWFPFGNLSRFFDDDELKVEEFVADDHLVVRVELPGVDPDKDVDISIQGGNLCIRAERRQEEKVERRDVRRSEIRYGSFSRVLPLPANAKEDDITATYRDGILEVRAPMHHGGEQQSRIPVSRG